MALSKIPLDKILPSFYNYTVLRGSRLGVGISFTFYRLKNLGIGSQVCRSISKQTLLSAKGGTTVTTPSRHIKNFSWKFFAAASFPLEKVSVISLSSIILAHQLFTRAECEGEGGCCNNCGPCKEKQSMPGPPTSIVSTPEKDAPKECTKARYSGREGKCGSCSSGNEQMQNDCQPNRKDNEVINAYRSSGLSPMNWCEPKELSHGSLVRQACRLAVDDVTRILCETIAAYQDYHERYRCLLDAMIDSLEYSRIAQGNQLELLDCKILVMRSEVDNMKNKIVELECFMGSVRRLAAAAAETAFLAHAEYSCVAMNERVHSVLNEMKAISEESARKERDMIELQSVVIVESGRGLK